MDAEDSKVIDYLNGLVNQLKNGQRVHLDDEGVSDHISPELLALQDNIRSLCEQYNDQYRFIMDLSRGELDTTPPPRNSFSSPYKQLHADLMHLTWQIRQISEGDYDQKVSFSGEFSESMNKMIESLREKRRIGDLNERYVKELCELNAMKDKFFSIIAHDLKNPFSGLLSLSGMLKDDLTEKKYDHVVEYAQLLHAFSEQGYKLLVNLLEWSRLQTSTIQVDLQPVLMSSILAESKDVVLPSALNKNIAISCEVEQENMILADGNMLYTVLRNLISNAVKYTPEGGSVSLKGKLDGQEALIVVQDTGVGMTPEQVQGLFRIDKSFSTRGTNNEEGTGLGLVLCHEFMKKMGGSISVTSEEGKGSTFSIRLPLAVNNRYI